MSDDSDDSDDLYALPPDQFTAARDALAKQLRGVGRRDQARAVAARRRPTVSAAVVNQLVRTDPTLVQQLIDLGAQLAQAQADGQGAALRSLGEQRRGLVEAVTDRAVEAAGRGTAPMVRAEVVATLEAALADPASAQAVRSGRLTRGLTYAGFGPVDLSGAVADPLAPGRTGAQDAAQPAVAQPAVAQPAVAQQAARKVAERRAALQQAGSTAHQAAGALDDAVLAHQLAAQSAAAAAAHAGRAEQAVRAAERALAHARDQRVAADAAQRRADREEQRRVAAVAAAQQAAQRARAGWDRLHRA